jgi:ribosomal protein S18 acetylase RimI-like enzyme
VIEYAGELDGIRPQHLEGFFVGWPSPPPPERHLEVLRGSSHVVLARDGERVVGFVTAISDGVLSAYIPLLEVLPDYQGRGIGAELVRRLLARLDGPYMVDLCCDEEVVGFYERLGLSRWDAGMGVRNRHVL